MPGHHKCSGVRGQHNSEASCSAHTFQRYEHYYHKLVGTSTKKQATFRKSCDVAYFFFQGVMIKVICSEVVVLLRQVPQKTRRENRSKGEKNEVHETVQPE